METLNEVVMICLCMAIFAVIIIQAINIIIMKDEIKNKPTTHKKDHTEDIKILLSDEKIIDKINNILYTMIKDASDRYMILNVNFNADDAYLKQETIEELSKYIFGTVKGNMTPALRGLFGLVYDISTEEKLDSLIDINIKMHILDLIVKTNQSV